MLRSERHPSRRSLKTARVTAAAVVAVTLLTLGAHSSLLLGGGPRELQEIPRELNLLIVTIDTLRADRLGCYGYKQARTPVIDSLAASGVRFENAYCLQPITLPSHATLFTGTHPAQHGVADNGLFLLSPQAETVAEALKREGMSTGAVIASFVLHRQFGLDQGFDTYDDTLAAGWKKDPEGFAEMTATGVSDRALEWIGQNADKRWFLWLHYYDPHADYLPPPAYRRLGGHPYDGEVAYVDFELGRVLDDLERRGLTERTLVILTSDHGESLGEHGEPTHGLFLYEGAMRVPLVVSLRGVIPDGRVASQLVSLMDVAPTVLPALGVATPSRFQGRSFLPLLFTDAAGWVEAPVVMETMMPWHSYGWSPSRAVVAEDFKFIDAPKPELYNLAVDPGELENTYDKDRVRAEAMARHLKTLRAGYGESSFEGEAGMEMDHETRSRLASLGYVFSGPVPGTPLPDAADAKDMVKGLDEMLSALGKALALHASGHEDEGISLLERVLEKSPDNRLVRNRLGMWYARKKDHQNAEKHFKRLLQIAPDFIDAYRNLGQLYAESARLEEATLLARAILSKFPRSTAAYGLMGFIRLQEKDYQDAVVYLSQAIDILPIYHEALVNRAVAYYFLGDKARALEDLKEASRIQPQNKDYAEFVKQLEVEMKQPRQF